MLHLNQTVDFGLKQQTGSYSDELSGTVCVENMEAAVKIL